MSNDGINTTALIICICVIIPALIAIAVCAIIYFSHRNKDRKFNRETNEFSSYEYEYPPERPPPQDTYIIDFTRGNRFQQQQRHPREPPRVIEQSPPLYNISIDQPRRQQIPLYSAGRTKPSLINTRRSSPMITPSVYSSMPPSYAEIFLSPLTLPNG